MDCLLRLVALCLFDPSAVSLQVDLAWQIDGKYDYWHREAPAVRYTGPIGRASLMVDIPATQSLTLRYGLEHRSFAESLRDRGEESAVLGFVWRPFVR